MSSYRSVYKPQEISFPERTSLRQTMRNVNCAFSHKQKCSSSQKRRTGARYVKDSSATQKYISSFSRLNRKFTVVKQRAQAALSGMLLTDTSNLAEHPIDKTTSAIETPGSFQQPEGGVKDNLEKLRSFRFKVKAHTTNFMLLSSQCVFV